MVSVLLLGLYVLGASPCASAYGEKESSTITVTHSHEHEHRHSHVHHHHHHEESQVPADSKIPDSKDNSTHTHEVMVFSCGAVCYISGAHPALYLPQPTEIRSYPVGHRLPNLLRLSSIFRPPIA